MGRQRWVYVRDRQQLPADFPRRIETFREATGLSRRGFARRLRTDPRLVRRWTNGTRPDAGHLYSLLSAAAGMGMLHILMPEAGRREAGDP